MRIDRRLSAARAPALLTAGALLSASLLGVSSTTTTAFAAESPAAHTAAAHNTSSQHTLTAAIADRPQLKLIVADKTVEAPKFGRGPVFFDPGIWLASLQSALQINVSRSSYTSPERAAEVLRTPGGPVHLSLPAWMLKKWNGLAHFFTVTVRDSQGHIIRQRAMTFCPDAFFGASKATPNSAATDPFPYQCNSFDPFPLGEVWGLPRGWADDAVGYQSFELPVGSYKVTISIGPRFAGWFGITPSNATASVTLKVIKGSQCCGPKGCCSARTPGAVPAGFVRVQHPAARHGGPNLPATRILAHPPADALPDLVPLPSWGIQVANPSPKAAKQTSFLDFGATVWIGGNAPLDVEGFRLPGTNTMRAYQYFYKNCKRLIGRMRVGSMGFSNYNAWHFNQFAQYKLLNSQKQVLVRSRKIGFCIAPTDSVNMLLPHATWQPSYTGIAGNCGDPAALWATEILPVGWGDTYFQSVPFQSFNITNIPNGTYYIEIIANPEHLLHETNAHNDISLRKVIIGGTPGHRTVRVPAWHGIDPEHGAGPIF